MGGNQNYPEIFSLSTKWNEAGMILGIIFWTFMDVQILV